MEKYFINFIKEYYQNKGSIALHEPRFIGNEKKYLLNAIDTTFVSSIGEYVPRFEQDICSFTNGNYALSVVNGTAAIQLSLHMCGIERNDLVISPSLTFVAACSVLIHMGAEPIFIDVDKTNLGICPNALELYLDENAVLDGDSCIHKISGRKIKAIIPMHTFGHPVKIDEIKKISQNGILLLLRMRLKP